MAIDDIVQEELFTASKDELQRIKNMVEERLEYLNRPEDNTIYASSSYESEEELIDEEEEED